MLRFAPAFAIAILAGPVFCGLIATLFPAFGYFPALGGNIFTFGYFVDLSTQPGLLLSCLISLACGLITCAISLAIVMGFLAAWSNTRWFIALQHTISPLLSVPHAAAAFGLAFLIAPSGWLMRLLSPEITGFDRPPDWLIINDTFGLSMMLGLIVKEIPFLFLVCLSALPQAQPRRLGALTASFGYGKIAGFTFVIWPLIYRQIRLAVFAVIAYASSVVDVALILGPTNPAPLAVRLISWMNDPDLSMRFQASAGAVLQLLVTVSALAIWIAGERLIGSLRRRFSEHGLRFRRDLILRYLTLILLSISVLLVFSGLFLLGIWSVAGFWPFPDAVPGSISLKSWSRQLSNIPTPLTTTIIVGLASTLAALVVVLACLERETRTGRDGGQRALLFVYLPLLVPQASFVFGLQLFFLYLGLDTSLVGLIFVHLIFVLPYLFLSLSDPWRAWDPRYGRVAKTLRSGENRIFWSVRMPMLLHATLIACAVGFATSVSQYLPTILIGAGRWPTITTEAVTLASGGDRRIIGVYAFLQMLLPFIGFVIATAIPAILFAKRRDMRPTG